MAREQAPNLGYIQQPSVCGDEIAFVAEGDVWIIGLSGGSPRRLTNFFGQDGGAQSPLFSPQGDRIAFSMGSDIWVLTVNDARCKRLTWLGGGSTRPVHWMTEPDALIIASTLADPFCRSRLYRVPLLGGEPAPLFEGGEYDSIAYASNGPGFCVGRHTADPVTSTLWKGYRGGQHGALWLDVDGSGSLRQIVLEDPCNPGGALNVACIFWSGERLAFTADPDGPSNLWSVNLQGSDLLKHTSHNSLFDVRNAKADAKAIVYTLGGDLWYLPAEALHGAEGCEPRHVRVDFGASCTHIPQSLSATDWLEEVILHPGGHVCACLCRGQVFEMALWEGPAVPMLGKSAAVARATARQESACCRSTRCKAMVYLFSGRLLTVSDVSMPLPTFTIHPCACMPHADSEQPATARDWLALFMADFGELTQELTLEKPLGDITELVASPVHDAVLVITARNQLWLLEFALEGGSKPSPKTDPIAKAEATLHLETQFLDTSEWEEGICDACWSPDGEWITYCRKEHRHGVSLILMNLEDGSKTELADSSFLNFCPRFHPDGLFLSFISSRTFAPVEDYITGDLNFSHGSSLPYLILLQKDARNPFQRSALSPSQYQELKEDDGDADDEEPEGEEGEDEDEDEEEKYEPPTPIQIDIDGIQGRILQFPLTPGNYNCGEWTSDGKFVYLRGVTKVRQPGKEEVDDDDDEINTFFAYDFKQLKEEELLQEVEDIEISMDLKDMLICQKDRDEDESKYYAIVAGQKPPWEAEDASDDVDPDTPGPESGLLDIDGRVDLQVTPSEEWEQIFAEICEHVKERFFDEACGGVDWDATTAAYQQLLPRIRCRAELTDLCEELLAELGVSHVYLSGPSDEESTPACQGHLGLRASWLDLEGGGVYRVDDIVKGDVWDPACSGPLARAGVGVTEGAYIVALNRIRVCKEMSLDQMLSNAFPREVFLTFVPAQDVSPFTELLRSLHKSGGSDGFRRLNTQQLRAMQEQTAAGKKKRKKKKKDKKGGAKAEEADIEKKLVALLKAVNIDISNGPIWRTVRVSTAGEAVAKSAGLRDLVEARGAMTRDASAGRVGYVYVPDTEHWGFAEFYRYFSRECEREALIIDLRCNAGGYAAELLMRLLRNVPIGWNVPRPGFGKRTLCPELCTSGRLVLLVDENTSSDGECWAEAFRAQGLGTVVGKRTWGGVVSIGGADFALLDGAVLTLPGEHYYTRASGYNLENRGALPDIVVEWPPDAAPGEDPQLQKAIAEALRLIESSAPLEPEIPPFPLTRLHRRKP